MSGSRVLNELVTCTEWEAQKDYMRNSKNLMLKNIVFIGFRSMGEGKEWLVMQHWGRWYHVNLTQQRIIWPLCGNIPASPHIWYKPFRWAGYPSTPRPESISVCRSWQHVSHLRAGHRLSDIYYSKYRMLCRIGGKSSRSHWCCAVWVAWHHPLS